MSQHDELALVLDVADYRETSSLVRVFTKNEGRISLVARGLRKQKVSAGMAALQSFNLVRVRYYLKEGSTIGTLAGADLELPASASRTSLDAYALISYWFEILKETSQERAALVDVFELTVEMLDHQESEPGIGLVFLRQLTKLCQYLGFGISWDQCVACGRESTSEPAAFSIKGGGIICDRCAAQGHTGLPLKRDEQAIIHYLVSAGEAPAVTQLSLVEFLTLLHRFLIHHVEHPLKTFGFVKSTLGG